MTNEHEMIDLVDETLENDIDLSSQNIDVATELLKSMKEANESLQRTTEKLRSMDETVEQSSSLIEKNWCRKKCNLIFYTLLLFGFLCIGIIALCKFYFKIDFF